VHRALTISSPHYQDNLLESPPAVSTHWRNARRDWHGLFFGGNAGSQRQSTARLLGDSIRKERYMSTEHLDVSTCPKCKGSHRYRLDVERSVVMRLMTMSDVPARPSPVRFTRFFTCPTKNEEFQASFVLRDTSSNKIRGVRVIGVADPNDGE
jgi:hypothetical protein